VVLLRYTAEYRDLGDTGIVTQVSTINIEVSHNTTVNRVFVGKEGKSKLTSFAVVSPWLDKLFGFFLYHRYKLAEPRDVEARLNHFLLFEKYLHTARGAVVTDQNTRVQTPEGIIQ